MFDKLSFDKKFREKLGFFYLLEIFINLRICQDELNLKKSYRINRNQPKFAASATAEKINGN